MTLGETLASLRKAKGLSQEQLSEELGLTRQTISKWELNQSTPDINYLVQLSDFFGVSTDYLIKGKKEDTITVSDNIVRESSNDAVVETASGGSNIYKWCILSGAILMMSSLIGISAFVICSALNPWIVVFDDMEFRGVLGYLLGTKTLWFFIILSVLFIIGFAISIYSIIKISKKK